MSKPIPGPMPIIEWSNKQIVAVPASGGSLSQADTVDQAAQRAGLPRAVVLAISRRSAFVRTTNVPVLSDRETAQLLSLQLGKLFPLEQGKVAYSFIIGNEQTEEGRLASVVAVPAETLKSAKEDLAKAGHHIAACIPSALGAVALADSLNVKDCAVVELGHEGLSIDIVKDGLLRYSRVAPKTTDPEAIQDEVCRTYSSVGIACGPVLAAGGLQMQSAAYQTSTSTLEALARIGLGLGVNVELPEEVAQRESRRISNRIRLAVVTCLAAIAVAGFTYVDYSNKATEVSKANDSWLLESRDVRKERDAATKEANDAKTFADKVRRVFEPAQKSSDILILAANTVPSGAWITGVSFDRGKALQIRGTAVNNEAVSAYLEALSAQDRFRDVKLVFANNGLIEKTTIVNFSISARAVGNVPLDEPKKAGKK